MNHVSVTRGGTSALDNTMIDVSVTRGGTSALDNTIIDMFLLLGVVIYIVF
jgi:hypothetical protein